MILADISSSERKAVLGLEDCYYVVGEDYFHHLNE